MAHDKGVVEARFNGRVVAACDAPVRLEGNAYFPPESVRWEHLHATRMKSLCFWKGVASYYTICVDGIEDRNGAWTYRHPSPLARGIKNHVAFWNGVEVVEGD